MRICTTLFTLLFYFFIPVKSFCFYDGQTTGLPHTIKVKGDLYYPPFEFINDQGMPDGFNIELFRELAKELNLNFTLELDQWSKVRHELETGKIDVITGMMVSTTRATKMLFGTPHSIMTHSIFSRKTDPFYNLSELKNKEIVVQSGDLMHDLIIETQLTDKIIAVSTQLEALTLINNGYHDAALIGNFQGSFLLKQYKLKNIHISGTGIEPQKYAMAVSHGNNELLWLLNTGLYQLKANGVYDKLYYQWFGIYEDYSFLKKHKEEFVLLGLAIAIMLFSIAFLRIRIKQARIKVLLSESRYRDIFENNHAVMFILDPDDGTFIDANPAAVKFYGYPKEELMGMRISEINTLNAKEIKSELLRAKEKNIHFFNFKHRLANGEIRDVEVYSGPIQFAKNKYLYSIVHDVTDKKNIENELKKSEEKLKLIFRMAPSGMGIIINRMFIDVNPRFCEITGYSQDELVGKNSRMIYCTDEEYNYVGTEKYRQIKEMGIGVVETRFRNKNGEIIDILLSSAAIDPTDFLKGIIFTATDVTLQKESSRLINLAYERIRLHIENSPLAVVEWDNQHRVKLWSKQAEILFGWSSDDVINKNPLEWNIVYKDDVAGVSEHMKKLITGFETSHISHNRNMTKDGRILHCQWYNSAIYDENGALISILSLVNNVTELKITEKNLVEERQRLAWIIDATNAGTWEWDIKNDHIIINVHFASIFGHHIDDLLPFSFEKLQALMHPDDMEPATAKLVEHFKKPLDEYEDEVRIRHKDGNWVWVQTKGRVISYSPMGDATYMVGMITNINQRKLAEEALKENEEKYRNLVDISPNAIFINQNNAITYLNPAACNLFGYSHPEEVLGRSPLDFFAPEFHDIIKDRIDQIINNQQYVPIIEEKIIRSNGEIRDVMVAATPFKIKGNIALQLVLRDVTDENIAEQKILNLNAELENKVEERTARLMDANKELEAFSYSVSHDLRAPLRAIEGFTRILTEDHAENLNEEGRRVCTVILGSTKKMNQLISDLLTFSRLTKAKINFAQVEMKELVNSVLEDFTNSGVNLQVNIEELGWSYCDANLIKQVWINLVSNAIKFTSKNHNPQIWISSYNEKNWCTYRIQDNGVGFDMNYVNKIFEVFQRLHSDKEFEGTGVGLAIVKRIIHRHGGKVWAEGSENQGATFFFSLPAESTFHE